MEDAIPLPHGVRGARLHSYSDPQGPIRARQKRSIPKRHTEEKRPEPGSEAALSKRRPPQRAQAAADAGLPEAYGDVRRVGVWLANQKQRRDRLDQAQRAALAELGVDWAG
ncbi:hypothetical protein [Streptomyces sp. NBC_00162]|uniref:hypothetical protein n=1 Tax=Streptomyces sp. NBC_00162 TaxID=2903629 RepID=UPI00214BA376|nr:hypothetical protein [Streptomyces sp. NBC_00162]UUU37803.1 hypothetical protein JIW86_02125 [Streptomyces sp. NBC_00162]